jgi:hypothetical protein
MSLIQDVHALNYLVTISLNTFYSVFTFVKTILPMGRDGILLLPRNQKILLTLGENIRLARLRRKFSSAIVAERANISRTYAASD